MGGWVGVSENAMKAFSMVHTVLTRQLHEQLLQKCCQLKGALNFVPRLGTL